MLKYSLKNFVVILLSIFLVVGSLEAAVNFDGVDDYLSGTFASLDNIGDSAYFFVIYYNGGETFPRLFQKQVNTTQKMLFFVDNGAPTLGSLTFEVDYSTTALDVKTADDVLIAGNYYIILVNWDGTVNRSGVDIYVNSTSEITNETLGSDGVGTYSDTGQTIYIGNRSDTTRTLNGRIYEIKIFDRALTATEIETLMNSRLKFIQDNLAAYWRLDDHTHNGTANSANGFSFKDLSGNNNILTATGCNAQAETVLNYPSPILMGQ